VLGFDVGDSEDGAFWTAFVRPLRARGLGVVQLAGHSDTHEAPQSRDRGGADRRTWHAGACISGARTIFAQPDADHVREQFDTIAVMLGRQLPKVEQMLRSTREDRLAFAGFRNSTGARSGPPTPLSVKRLKP
jgi:transposase-like protein